MHQRPQCMRRPQQTGPNVQHTPHHPAAGVHVVPSLRLPLGPRQVLQLARSLRGDTGGGNGHSGLRTQCVDWVMSPLRGKRGRANCRGYSWTSGEEGRGCLVGWGHLYLTLVVADLSWFMASYTYISYIFVYIYVYSVYVYMNMYTYIYIP